MIAERKFASSAKPGFRAPAKRRCASRVGTHRKSRITGPPAPHMPSMCTRLAPSQSDGNPADNPRAAIAPCISGGRSFDLPIKTSASAHQRSLILRPAESAPTQADGRRSSGTLGRWRFTSSIRTRAALVSCILGRRSSSSAIRTRARVPYLSRCFTRAKSSPFARWRAEARRSSGTLGGRSFTSGIPMRAIARYLSRCFTRAKSSLFVRLHSVARGGTVNRPRTHVTRRKQTPGHDQGRNFPVHFLFPVSRSNLRLAARTNRRRRAAAKPRLARCVLARRSFTSGIPMRVALVSCVLEGRTFTSSIPMRAALVSCILGGRSFSSAIRTRAGARYLSRCFTRAKPSLPALTSHQSLLTNHGVLPGAVTRVEPLLSHRKQKTAHASTRNVPAHEFLRQRFASAKALPPARRRSSQLFVPSGPITLAAILATKARGANRSPKTIQRLRPPEITLLFPCAKPPSPTRATLSAASANRKARSG
jgi:hypothetical protein